MFHVSFQRGELPPGATVDIDPLLEGEETLGYVAIMLACAALERVPGSRFDLSGFGRDRWSGDVGYEMSAFLEEISEVIGGLRADGCATLSYYPPGNELDFAFRRDGEWVHITCQPWHQRQDWKPEPETETLAYDALLSMVSRLVIDVTAALAQIAPELASQPPFDRWAHGRV